ncbi:hypothetical protein PVAG01_05816 [Phlyctema vagabunda]|uniref:AAA+ ATPase domain-containing protein n=1 Tax=Phlyctema vagabunda TaxID=108571 RepID=A0ABR4PEA3_9HELO
MEASLLSQPTSPFHILPHSAKEKGSESVIENDVAASDLTNDVKVVYKNVEVTGSGSTVEKSGSPPTPQDKSPPTKGEAMIVYTYYEKDQKFSKHKVQIKSNELVTLMRETMSKMIKHEGLSRLWKEAPVTIEFPNVLITYCIDDLREAAQSHDDKTAIKELECFLKHVDDFFQTELWETRKTILETQGVTFSGIWMLFSPGTQIVAKPFQDQEQLFVVHRHSVDEDYFVITCWCYDWNGSSLVRQYYDIRIKRFLDTKKITELECYPVQYYHQANINEKLLRARLIERGKRMKEFCTPALLEDGPRLYQSTAFYDTSGPQSELLISLRELYGDFRQDTAVKEFKAEHGLPLDVVVDAELCRQYSWWSYQYLGELALKTDKTPCECSLCDLGGRRKPFEENFNDVGGESTTDTSTEATSTASAYDELFALLTPRLHGYSVTNKIWGQMSVDDISIENPIIDGIGEDPWNELTLDQQHKDSIQALVTSYFTRVAQARSTQDIHINIQDPVARKGNGVVILLHGIPGVGKTMTAETLAKSQRRRLLRIDASDFQHNDPAQVSSAFKKFFHMATSWGYLLLLDEADVFLQSRKHDEQNQNALVSILLQELEYFHGVLIMTTNRIVSVDYAVQSRIHYAVRFTDLDRSQIDRIWATFRKQLTTSNCTENEQAKIDDWFNIAKHSMKTTKFTGRDIRNVFIIAQLLGYPHITKSNIEKAVIQTQSFRMDLEAISQKAAQQNAILGDRN